MAGNVAHQESREQPHADVEGIDVRPEVLVVGVLVHPPAGFVRAPVGDNFFRRSRRGRSAHGGLGSRIGVELPQRVAELVEIHDGEAAATARALRLRLKIDGRAAARALDRHQLLLERVDFLRRQAAHQALAAKELEERHEDAVTVGAAEVVVLVVANEIVGDAQGSLQRGHVQRVPTRWRGWSRLASTRRTSTSVAAGVSRNCSPASNQNPRQAVADVDRHRAAVGALERHRLHRLLTSRTRHRAAPRRTTACP